MNQTSAINLLIAPDVKSEKLSTNKSANGLVEEGGVSKFQATLEGLLNGTLTAAQAGLNLGENGEINLEALKGLESINGMNQEQLFAFLNTQGITPEMLLDTAGQLQTAGGINALSPDQLALLQLLGGLGANGANAEASLASLTASAINPKAIVANNGATPSTLSNATEGANGLPDSSIKSAVTILTNLAQAINGKNNVAKASGGQNNVILEASEANVVAGSLIANVAQKLNQEGVIAPVDTGADDSQPLDPQNIASTVLNAGAVVNGQENKPLQANSSEILAAGSENGKQGKVNPLANLSNDGGEAGSNNANGQNANGQNAKSNPLLAQLNQAKSNQFGLQAQSNNSTVPVPTLTAAAPEAILATANTPHAMQAQTATPIGFFDAAPVDAGSQAQSTAGQSTQALINNAASIEAQSSSLLKESVKAVRIASPLPQTISHNIGLQVSKAVANGQTDFTIRIDPPELGRVNVKVEFSAEGSMRAMVTVDTKEALNLLQRDAHVLERALGDLGSKLDQGGLNFSLKDQNRDAGNDELNAHKDTGNDSDFEDALNGDDIIADILPYVDASRTLDIRI